MFRAWESNNQPLVIPNGVTTISHNAFSYWESNNQPLVIPDSVITIGHSTFSNWKSNNHPLVIPNSVTTIDNYAFSRWESNNHPLVIPNSVTTIGFGVFEFWKIVPYIEMKRTTPPTINIDTFNHQNDAPIYVPDASLNAYKTATNWVNYANRIFPVSEKEV